jgi:hypothetical protein
MPDLDIGAGPPVVADGVEEVGAMFAVRSFFGCGATWNTH